MASPTQIADHGELSQHDSTYTDGNTTTGAPCSTQPAGSSASEDSYQSDSDSDSTREMSSDEEYIKQRLDHHRVALDSIASCKTLQEFYKAQSVHNITNNNLEEFGVYVSGKVQDSDPWKLTLDWAKEEMSTAAPGIVFITCDDKATAAIQIYDKGEDTILDNMNTLAYTRGKITSQSGAEIFFDTTAIVSEDEQQKRRRHVIHELLHALGYEHEHQRKDASGHFDIGINVKKKKYRTKRKICGLTRIDPFSVMMYTEREGKFQRSDEVDSEPAWRLKKKGEPNYVLSELDKVGLNLLYSPKFCPNVYEPKLSPVTGLYYCSRPVMTDHNRPLGQFNAGDNKCGGQDESHKQGPNCPACRTLKVQVLPFDDARWQGWSGLVYCGKQFQEQSQELFDVGMPVHDGFCGPDYGEPCPDCHAILYPSDN